MISVALPVGTRLYAGTVELRMTQIGKECHSHCAIYHRVGECIMPREGVFAEVVKEGMIRPGDVMRVWKHRMRTVPSRRRSSS